MVRAASWRARLSRVGLAPEIAAWLREPNSLTARLIRNGTFRVQVLHQYLHHANPDECEVLGLQRDTRCHVREVVLYSNGTPVIFAHTILPASPSGVLSHWFARLGSRSLGSLLFAHPGFERGTLAFAGIDARHPFYATALRLGGLLGRDAPARFAARRCLHHYGRQSVLVSEVFLPAIARCV